VKWPAGFSSAGIACGLKPSGGLDLGVLTCDVPAAWAGTFTKNAAAAAPVHWCRARGDDDVRAVVVNSGNANACTGRSGEAAVAATVAAAARVLHCDERQILVASTGLIGTPLPVERITGALPEASALLSEDVGDFAASIMTTDKSLKTSSWSGSATVVGVAKGAAMLAPNMATMLAFIATDAEVARDDLRKITSAAVAQSFDRVCVDACESTNDAVICLASGRRPVGIDDLFEGLTKVCRDLAYQMVTDAEGGTKLLRIRVSGASDEPSAVALGRSIASSNLWRAAVHGGDPNWGRVLAAMGSLDRALALGEIDVSLGGTTVFRAGEPVDVGQAAHEEMRASEIVVSCVVGGGPGEAEILSTDLSPEYVTLNAEYTT